MAIQGSEKKSKQTHAFDAFASFGANAGPPFRCWEASSARQKLISLHHDVARQKLPIATRSSLPHYDGSWTSEVLDSSPLQQKMNKTALGTRPATAPTAGVVACAAADGVAQTVHVNTPFLCSDKIAAAEHQENEIQRRLSSMSATCRK